MGIEWVGVFPSSPPFTPYVSVLLSKSSTVRHAAVLSSVFESPGWQAVIEEERTKLELKNGRYIYCIERDGLLCLVAVISAEGSGAGSSDSHLIFSATSSSTPRFMTALKSAVRDAGGHTTTTDAARQLKRNLKAATLTELAQRFSNAESFDKVAATARKVNDLKVTMHATLLKATERDMLIETLDIKAKDLRTSAHEMFEGSKSIRRSLCRRYACCFAGVTFFVCALIFIVIMCLNYYQFHWW